MFDYRVSSARDWCLFGRQIDPPRANAVFFHVGLLSLLERAITIPGETKSSILLNWPSLFSTCDVISGSWTLGNVCPVSVAVSVEFSLDTDLTTAGEIRDL